MAQKFTYNYVKTYIEATGYKLLSTVYINTHTKLLIQCKKGHIYKQCFNVFKKGYRCPICARNSRYTYNQVKEYFKKHNHIIIAGEYANIHSKLLVKCMCGNIYITTFNKFKNRKNKCPVCDNYFITTKKVRQYLKQYGHTLLSIYKGAKYKLKIRCANGHIYYKTWNSIKYGQLCPICSKKKKLSINYIKNQMLKEGYCLLTRDYINNKHVLEVKCPNGHVYTTCWNYWQQGNRCPICAGNIKYSQEELITYFKYYGYTLLSPYKNNKTKLTLLCPNNHKFKMTLNNFMCGQRCPICMRWRSKYELELEDILKSWGIDFRSNDKTILKNPYTGRPLELDFYIPILKKAIEFNGKYWHNLAKIQKRDVIKMEVCVNNNIELFVINEDDWLNDKVKILKQLKQFLNINFLNN